MIKLLDCTLRDGGYYTDWDFDKSLVISYCQAMNRLPIEYIEVGYRSIDLKGYYGEYYYCPISLLTELKKLLPNKKLTIILNEKDIKPEHVITLLKPCIPFISLVRIAVDPVNFKRALVLSKEIKKLGFEVGFNLMYLSDWDEKSEFINYLEFIDNKDLDYLYMVDSYGGVMVDKLEKMASVFRSKTNIPLGFHGHNNIEMALTNSIFALNNGFKIIDATILGMGRGAGNLKMELFLIYLNKLYNLNLDFDKLSKVCAEFDKLKKIHKWGISLPYIFSGINSLPQKEVMELIGMERFPLDIVISSLKNNFSKKPHLKFPILNKNKESEQVFIIGGGLSVNKIFKYLHSYFNKNSGIVIIHTGLKYVNEFKDLVNKQYYCLTGFEGGKIDDAFDNSLIDNKKFIFYPSPRIMGQNTPEWINKHAFEIEKLSFLNNKNYSTLLLGLQVALNYNSKNIYIAGFDGYEYSTIPSKMKLTQENQIIFDEFKNHFTGNLLSITKTMYIGLELTSIYNKID